MPSRPWVTSEQVKDYSEINAVRNRSDDRVRFDISRAEEYVISYTNNSFEDYERIPQSVKTAVILLAEAYGSNAASASRELASETFDDYSYTAKFSEIKTDSLYLSSLLDKYKLSGVKGNVNVRLRRL